MNTHEPSQPASDRPADDHVERLLTAFAPRPARLDRDRLMFLAGQAAANHSALVPAPRVAWYWPASTALASACSLVLAIVVAVQFSASKSETRTVIAQETPPNSQAEPPMERTQHPLDSSDAPRVAHPDQLLASANSPPEMRRVDIDPNSYLSARDAAVLEKYDSPVPMGALDNDVGLPNSYLRAVRSVIERPQSLLVGLRY